MGIVSDNPYQKINYKVFHSEIQNGHAAIKAEEQGYRPVPVIDAVTEEDVQENYKKIKREVEELLERVLAHLESLRPEQPETEADKSETEGKGSDGHTVSM